MGSQSDRKRQQNQGAAMVVAIVVGVVLMTFALTLLLISYSLFSSAPGRVTNFQCKELAKSINKELRQELTTPDYDSYEEQLEAVGNENNLWFFLRYNLWQDDAWQYYNDGETGHGVTDSYKYFTLNALGNDQFQGMADQILITMYWEIDSDKPSEETDKSLTELHVIITVTKGDDTYSLESEFALTVVAYESTVGYGNMETVDNTSINPYGKSIDTNEKWMWVLD